MIYLISKLSKGRFKIYNTKLRQHSLNCVSDERNIEILIAMLQIWNHHPTKSLPRTLCHHCQWGAGKKCANFQPSIFRPAGVFCAMYNFPALCVSKRWPLWLWDEFNVNRGCYRVILTLDLVTGSTRSLEWKSSCIEFPTLLTYVSILLDPKGQNDTNFKII